MIEVRLIVPFETIRYQPWGFKDTGSAWQAEGSFGSFISIDKTTGVITQSGFSYLLLDWGYCGYLEAVDVGDP